MRRALAAAVVVTGFVLVDASPAAAHTITGVKPTNYASRVVTVRPAVGGVRVRLLDLGRRVELTNDSGADVVVFGYYREPYLKVGPSGAFANRRSPSVAQNRVAQPGATTTTTGGVPVNPTLVQVAPDWRRISGAHRLRWRDQRTRYEGPRITGGQPRQLSSWTLELQRNDRTINVVGVTTYVPGPSPLPWVALMVVLAGATVAAGLTKRWGQWLSVALALLIASDAIHTVGTAAATHDPIGALLLRVLVGGLVSTAAWIVGVIAIPALQRNHEGGLVAAGGVGLVVATFSGVTDVGVFASSQVATIFPAVTARVAVAIALGLGIGLVLAAIAVIARDPALRPTVIGTAMNAPDQQSSSGTRAQSPR